VQTFCEDRSAQNILRENMSQALIVNPLGRGVVLKNKFGSKVLENATAASPKSYALFLAL
jgi:hypothetical protein